jgi:hypothetical protein
MLFLVTDRRGLATQAEERFHRPPAADFFRDVMEMDMSEKQAPCTRNAKRVFLLPCDDGIKMVFTSDTGESSAVTMDWVTAADMALRLDQLGAEALTMMQIGLSPYQSSHRESFFVAALEASVEAPRGN